MNKIDKINEEHLIETQTNLLKMWKILDIVNKNIDQKYIDKIRKENNILFEYIHRSQIVIDRRKDDIKISRDEYEPQNLIHHLIIIQLTELLILAVHKIKIIFKNYEDRNVIA